MLRTDPLVRAKKAFKLYQEKGLFRDPRRLLATTEMVDRGTDDDVASDEDIVHAAVKKCQRELRAQIRNFLEGNPFELVRNIRTPQKNGVLAEESYQPSSEEEDS